jgi:hypothetical protein
LRRSKKLTGIKLHDGAIIFARAAQRYPEGWQFEEFKFISPDGEIKTVNDGPIKVHDDAIDMVIHLHRGGKKREKKHGYRKENRDGSPPSA